MGCQIVQGEKSRGLLSVVFYKGFKPRPSRRSASRRLIGSPLASTPSSLATSEGPSRPSSGPFLRLSGQDNVGAQGRARFHIRQSRRFRPYASRPFSNRPKPMMEALKDIWAWWRCV
jgi:hypothetical protein